MTTDQIIEWTAAAFGLLSVGLTIRQHLLCWPIGIVNVALYIWVFFQSKLYSDAGLQVVYVVLQFYGWHEWLHGGEAKSELHVSSTPGRFRPVLLCLGIAGTLGLGAFFDTRTDAAMPYWDAGITSFSLVAQWMMAKKFLENWIVWLLVDVVAIGVFAVKGLYPTALLYAVFCGMAISGYLQWRKSIPAANPA